jgi:hypothetical protein
VDSDRTGKPAGRSPGARLLLPFEPTRKRDRDVMAGYGLEPMPTIDPPMDVKQPVDEAVEPYRMNPPESDRAAIADTRRRISEAMAAAQVAPVSDRAASSINPVLAGQ